MIISDTYVAVEQIEEPKEEGFQTVKRQDSFIYKGRVTHSPEGFFMGNRKVVNGDTILFAKYSPDTHEIEHEGKTMKFVSRRDVLAVL